MIPSRSNFVSPRRLSAGFTLVEMMTVVGIIVIALAMAVPVINTLTGNRSFEAGYNRISGVLGHARQLAIFTHRTCGIFTFIDPATQKQDIVYVYQTNPGAPVPYLDIIRSDMDGNSGPATEEQVAMPPGVSMDVISTGSPSSGTDRYLGFGAILFDANGQLLITRYLVPTTDNAGTFISAQPNLLASWLRIPIDLSATTLFTSQAVNIYDRSSYKAQVLQSGVNAGTNFNDLSLQYATFFSTSNPTIYNSSTITANPADKQAEEDWLDKNGLIMVIKPNDGSVLRNQ